jgi:AcrR family transcriptional regulator
VPKPRRELQSADSIVEIAADLFYRQGYDATSMQDIAAAAMINKSSLYHHIRSKEEILEAICSRTFAQLNAGLDEVESSAGEPGERVLLAFAAAVRTALNDPRGTSIIIRLQGKTEVAQKVRSWRRDYEQRFTRLVATAQHSGDVRSDIDAAMLARLVLGMVNWVVGWFEPRGQSFSASSVEAAVVAVAANGLAGPGGHLTAQ